MRILILFLVLLGPAYSVEIATIDLQKSGEHLVVVTDETLQALLEKNFLAKNCQPRQSISLNLREYYFPRSCRAHVTQFLINAGYKADPSGLFFAK